MYKLQSDPNSNADLFIVISPEIMKIIELVLFLLDSWKLASQRLQLIILIYNNFYFNFSKKLDTHFVEFIFLKFLTF